MRLQFRGAPIRQTRQQLDSDRKRLDRLQKTLNQQRAEQAALLLRINWETEEIKRQLAAVQTRIRYLEDEDVRQWLGRESPASPLSKSNNSVHVAPPKAPEPIQAATAAPAAALPRAKLGDQLLDNGIINNMQLQLAIERQQAYGGRLGDILIELGFVTAEQLLPYVGNAVQKARLGDLLVQSGYITQVQLDKALAFQRKSGGLLGDILLSLQFLEPEQLYRIVANQNSIGRIGSELTLDTQVKLPEAIAREYGAVLIHEYPNRFLLAVNEPLTKERLDVLLELLEKPIEQVLASKSEMELFWSDVYGDEMLEESTSKLAVEQPHNSASTTFTKGQIVFGFVALALMIAGLAANAWLTLIIANVCIQVFYFFMTLFKFMIILYGSRSGAQYRYTQEQLDAIDERDLPIYTILVPMYKESQVIPHLIRNLEKLDYPKAKLDVRLLIEKDDAEALQVLKTMNLPPYYSVLVVPDSLPKTKPKACNFGLIRARGKYVVIFDAEDRPDPDQLKKVHLTFESCGEETVCVQAKLNYFNSGQNLLTRWFTQEYSMWFELLLPGIMKLDIPIPLGGTSNHFKTDVLKSLNAWDPYNVTEDADLGIRLYKEGYKTAIVDSRTWEEANSRFGNWIRQRSRWIKGYMQTWLVHMRNPVRLCREVGLRGFMGFHVMVLATPMLPLLNPLFWSMIIVWFVWKASWIKPLFPSSVYYFASAEFYFANFLFVFSNAAGVYWVIHELEKRGERYFSYGLIRSALLTPLYWVMMSIAAIKAAWQLITKPFYWEKTQHGLTDSEHIS